MRWLVRVFVSALVRRLAISAALVLLAVFGSCSKAHATDQGESVVIVVADLKARCALYAGSTLKNLSITDQDGWRTLGSAKCYVGEQLNAVLESSSNYEGSCGGRNSNPALNKLGDTQPGYSAPKTCYAGCKVQGDIISNSQPGGVTMSSMVNRTWSADTCSVGDNGDAVTQEPNKADAISVDPKPECTALGNGQTGCVKANGDWCATASTGKTFCWTPKEEGAKVDGTDAQVKSKQGEPVTPPSMSIADSEAQRTEGHQVTACVNSTCKTYNVTNFTSVAAGTAKNSTGDNKSDGTGNTSGNGTVGTNAGSGSDDTSKDSASDSGNCDTPPQCTGDTLKCLQLKFTWKNQCNTAHDEITKGDGCGDSDVPVCAGKSCKAQAYAQLLQQWQQKCSAQKIGEGLATRAGKNGEGDEGDADAVKGIWKEDSAGTGPVFNTGLVTVAGGGPLLPDVELDGKKWVVPQNFYDVIAALRVLVIAMATIIAAFVAGKVI